MIESSRTAAAEASRCNTQHNTAAKLVSALELYYPTLTLSARYIEESPKLQATINFHALHGPEFFWRPSVDSLADMDIAASLSALSTERRGTLRLPCDLGD